MGSPSLLIFTDMDGSLLDHYSYSHEPAKDMLTQLKKLSIPVIANTSKTFAELIELRQRIDNQDAFIAENGAAVYLPKLQWPKQPTGTESFQSYWVKSFCPPRAHWQKLISEVAKDFSGDFETFESGGVDAIMQWTGLGRADAELASQRQFGEPVRWLGSEQKAQEFKQCLHESGATVLQGGRFIHVSGKSDKGLAMHWLADLYGQPKTLALGDGPNDIAMLESSDYAVVIKSPVNPAPNLLDKNQRIASGNLLYSKACGPEGWVEGAAHFLTKMNMT